MLSNLQSSGQTANEFIALEQIDRATGAAGSAAFLYDLARGTQVLSGGGDSLIVPGLSIDGQQVQLEDLQWEKLGYWVPQFSMRTSAGTLQGTYLAPVGRRGIIVRLEFHSCRSAQISLSVGFNWAETLHFSHRPRAIHGERIGGLITHQPDAMYFEFVSGWPRFGLALAAECEAEHLLRCGDLLLGPDLPEITSLRHGEVMRGSMTRTSDLQSAETLTLTVHFGVGVDIRSALAITEELRTTSFAALMADTMQWLSDREIRCSGRAEGLADVINCNSLYNHFNSCGVAIDSDRLVVTSGRSPAYEMNGTYADRDACLYSIPSVLLEDPLQARRMLEYVFAVQMRSPGLLSKYMDGVPLQTGFSLDAVVAPLRALWMYVSITDDPTILFLQSVQSGINRIIRLLEERIHPDIPLISTAMCPSGKPPQMPYVTYSNILVWRALMDLSDLYHRIRDVERRHETAEWASELQEAVIDNCIVTGPGGPMFCFCLDLAGGYNLGDEPEGSLMLAGALEFCKRSFEPLRNTIAWIRETYGDYAPSEQSLVIANRLLSGDLTAVERLRGPEGVVDEGALCKYPAGWSGSSGYLSYSLVLAYEKDVDPPATREPSSRKSRITRENARPGVGWI